MYIFFSQMHESFVFDQSMSLFISLSARFVNALPNNVPITAPATISTPGIGIAIPIALPITSPAKFAPLLIKLSATKAPSVWVTASTLDSPSWSRLIILLVISMPVVKWESILEPKLISPAI